MFYLLFLCLLLHRFVCFFIFVRSEVHHVISRHPFIFVLEIAFSQALVIQFVNSVVASFGLLERLGGFILISSFPFPTLLAADCTMSF